MANASVEKLKALGLRHGEKAVMGLAATLCVLFLFMAVSRPTIQLTPEDVRKAAESADSNLKRRQSNDDVLKRLEQEGITDPHFEKTVDNQTKNKIDVAAYAIKSPWATPEPGAGLIRDTPELIAPTELVAYPGRGGALVYELKDGERVPDESGDQPPPDTTARRRRKGRRGRFGGGMLAGGGAEKSAEQLKKEQADYERQRKRVASGLVGKAADPSKDAAEQPTEPEGPFKEITKGLRWVSITGVLDYKKLRENYLTALKVQGVAYPHFKELSAERQVLQSDGSWSDWEAIDSEKNLEVLNNLPEEDEEWAPDTVLFDALVDPLPFLRAGYWERVHVAKLVPKEKREVPKPDANVAGMPGMGRGPGMAEGMGMPMSKSMMTGGMMPGGGMPGMGMGGMDMYGGGDEDMSFQHNEEETLMVRLLDFTAEPDTTYRYRLRIVVFNPNRGHEDVSPGVDTKSIELFGPWSKPTDEVTLPADVAAYAIAPAAGARGGQEEVKFEITRWNPSNGVMVVKQFDAGPGDIIGEVSSMRIPTSDGSQPKSEKIDFNCHQVVLDAMGGDRPIPRALDNGRFTVPAVSLLLRPDGSVALRNQTFDLPDDVRKTIVDNYKRELEESGKQRESSTGAMPGMAP